MKNIIYHLELCFFTSAFLCSVTAIVLLCFTCCPYTDYDINRSYSVLEVIFSAPENLIESSYRFSSICVFGSALDGGYTAMFIPAIAPLSFVVSFCACRKSKFTRFEISRTGYLKNYLSRFISAILTGGICVMLGILLFGISVGFLFPDISSYNLSPDEMTRLFPHGEVIYIIKKLISAFLFGAFASAPSFILCALCSNVYLILCVPFLLFYVWNMAITKISLYAFENGINALSSAIPPFSPTAVLQLLYSKELYFIIATSSVILLFFVLSFIGYVLKKKTEIDRGE